MLTNPYDLIKKTQTQVFSGEFCAMLKNISEHLQAIACEQSGCLAGNISFKSTTKTLEKQSLQVFPSKSKGIRMT